MQFVHVDRDQRTQNVQIGSAGVKVPGAGGAVKNYGLQILASRFLQPAYQFVQFSFHCRTCRPLYMFRLPASTGAAATTRSAPKPPKPPPATAPTTPSPPPSTGTAPASPAPTGHGADDGSNPPTAAAGP